VKNYFLKLKTIDDTEIVINTENIIYIEGENKKGYYYLKNIDMLNMYIDYDEYLKLKEFIINKKYDGKIIFIKLCKRSFGEIIVNIKFVNMIYSDDGFYLNSKTNKVFKERDYKLKIKGEQFNKWLTEESYYRLEKILLSDQKGDKVNE